MIFLSHFITHNQDTWVRTYDKFTHYHMHLYLTRPSTTYQLGATPYSDLASNPMAKLNLATPRSLDIFSNT